MDNMTWIILGVLAIVMFINTRNKMAIYKSGKVKNVTPDETQELIKSNKDILILDVRTKPEYKGGHIPKSKSIPLNELGSSLPTIEKYKDKPIIVHCASGGRSPKAVSILLKGGFNNIYHLNRGLSNYNYKLTK